jgi:hypothetical protein
MTPAAIDSIRRRLAARCVRSPSGCLEWTGVRINTGYGQIGYQQGGKTLSITTHRAAWIVAHGEIPEGLHVCHHCDNRLCCDETHLFLGSRFDNMRDAARKRRLAPQVYPERHSRGARHYTRVHPEKVLRGERHGRALVTEQDVVAIRARAAAGERISEIAKSVGLARPTASGIVHRRIWRHVP